MDIAQAVAFGNLLKKLNILVIDDFQGMRTMLRGIVREMGGVKVDTASNGREAINQLRLLRYDIVICDYNLGDGPNGQHVLEEAKLNDLLSPAAVWIMVTAEKTSDMVMGTAEVRPDDYILKPVNHEMLEGRLEKLIMRKQAMAAIEREIKARKYLNALEECDALLAKSPANQAEVLRIKTDVLMLLGRYEDARPIFESVQAQRSVAWAKTGLGKVCFHQHKLEEAEALFREVLAENRIYMEAYDWLVKTLQARGDLENAQKVLQTAVQLSPHSATRQQTLGEVSHQNGDLAQAQSAYERTLRISEFSPYKSAASYAGLAKVLVDGNDSEQALKVLERGKKDFKGNDTALLETSLVEGMVLQKMGQPEKAQECIRQASALGQKIGGALEPRLTLEMASALFAVGDKEAAAGLLRDLVRNNHESQALTDKVQQLFEQASMGDEGSAIIHAARQQVIQINNQGVALGREGKIDAAVELLREALREMPHSETIMMNLCGLLIVMLKKAGSHSALVTEIRALLDRVHEINPTNRRHQEYTAVLKALAGT